MDSLLGASVVVGSEKQAVVASGGFTETLLCVIVAMVVLRLEHQRRAGAGPMWGSWSTDSARRLLKECAPEAALLLSCLTLAALLRSQGEGVVELEGESSQEAWEQIKSEWPLLVTADTLLSLQAMLRLVVMLSVVLRLGGAGGVPLSQEAAALSLFAGLSRFALWYRTSAYALDGPLGGNLPVACEVAILPILMVVARGALWRSIMPLAMALISVGFFASRNYLALVPDDSIADSLFIAAHCFDIIAAFVYLGRSMLVEAAPGCNINIGFTHLLMPVQQGLSAYFFLQAFTATDDLVGAGRPFDVLHAGGAAGLGAYFAAAALFAAERFDGDRPIAV